MFEDIHFYTWLLLLIPAFYAGMPLVIRFQMTMAAHPPCQELALEQLETKTAAFLMTQTKALFEAGFDEPTLLHVPQATSNVTAYLIMLVNRAAGDKAMVTALIGQSTAVTLRTCYVEFSTRFANDDCFNTSNCRELSAFAPGPKTVRTRTPSVQDPCKLYQLHQFVMSKHDSAGKKVMYEQGQALDYFANIVLIESYDKQVERGWLFYDRSADCYRPTLKGAFLMTWGLLQPMKVIRTMMMHMKAKKALQEFERACSVGLFAAQMRR